MSKRNNTQQPRMVVSISQKKGKKSQKRNRGPRNRPVQLMPPLLTPSPQYRVRVRECTARYAKALCNPFDRAIPGDICLPDDSDLQSFKFHCRTTGIAYTGVNGIGWVSAGVYSAVSSGMQASSTSSATTTSSTITSRSSDTTLTVATSNSPFSGSADGSGRPKFRPVIVALRVRYIGTELDRGGQLIPFRSRVAGNIDDTAYGLDYSGIMKRGLATSEPVDRKWHTIVWTPIAPMDKEYTAISDNPYSNYYSGSQDLVWMFTGVASKPMFEFETIWFYEAIPWSFNNTTYAPPSSSKSETDLPGYSFVKDIFTSVSDNVSGQQLWNLLQSAAKNYVTGEMPFPTASLEWN